MSKRGGIRPGAGRKPGAAWNGSGEYEKMEQLHVRVPPRLKRWLEEEAERQGRSMSAIIVSALELEKEQRDDSKESSI